MNGCRILAGLAIAVVTVTMPATSVAQERGEAGRANPPAAAPTNAELVSMLDAYAIVQAQKALELTDEQYVQFIARLRRLQDTRRRNMQARNRLVQDLRRMLAPDVTTEESTLRDRMKALRDVDDQAAQAMRREYDSLDEILSPRQQARFRIFEERMERQKLDLLMRAMRAGERGARAGPQRRNDGDK
jgi:hypothetical protein